MEVYVRTEKPFVVGDVSPWIDFVDFEALETEAIERTAENNDVEVSVVEENRDDYEDQIDEARWDIESETENPLLEAIQTVANKYDADASELFNSVMDVQSEGTTSSNLEEILRASEGLLYAEDPETGDAVGYHMLGEIIQELGFDSIILKNADERFSTMQMDDGTAHVHVFDKHNTNIKSVDNRGTFDINDPRILYQGKEATAADVSEFQDGLIEKLGLRDLSLYLSGESDLKISMIAVAKDGQSGGIGTSAMKEIVDFADANGLRVILTPGQRDDGFGTTSRSRLVKFYKRFGFVENKGRNKDFSISESMYRESSRELMQGARGSIVLPRGGLKEGETVINLFESANLSTFLH